VSPSEAGLHLYSYSDIACSFTGCGKTMLARWSFDGLHVWDKPGLSGYLVCLVHLVSLMQPNKPDRPNRPNEQDGLADFFSILLKTIHLLLAE
jgi:hypothetical protein